MPGILTIARRTLFAAWVALLGFVLALVLSAHVAGLLGYRVVIIRGASMAPAIPLGAAVFEQTIPAADLRAGDVITLSLPQGAVVTHRVVRVATLDGATYVQTRGDANADPDTALQPATAVTGVVRLAVPLLGFALAFLGIPSGILSVVSMLGSLLAAVWLIEEVEADRRVARTPPTAALDVVPA
jgi:signal peptidase